MAETAREYLMHRFRGDAHALRERTAALRQGTKIPGPDATTSGRMADACDVVVRLLEGLGSQDDVPREIAALVALIPHLEERARASATIPPVRAVYAGAATRIREVETAEAQARAAARDDDDDEVPGIDDGGDPSAGDEDFEDDADEAFGDETDA
jgi:hypothetical protein